MAAVPPRQLDRLGVGFAECDCHLEFLLAHHTSTPVGYDGFPAAAAPAADPTSSLSPRVMAWWRLDCFADGWQGHERSRFADAHEAGRPGGVIGRARLFGPWTAEPA